MQKTQMVPIGLSLSDIKEAIKLSWKFYDALKNAPNEAKDMAKDFAILSGVLNQIQDDLNRGNDSAIAAHGERRMRLLESITADLMQTLAEVQTLVDKFRPLVEAGRMSEEIWRKIKFKMSQTKIHSIQKSITAHISAFSLLLTSMGNSSLHRIEAGLKELRLKDNSVEVDFSGSVEESGNPTHYSTTTGAEQDNVEDHTLQQPPSIPLNRTSVLHREPPPNATILPFDPRITDPLGIEVSMQHSKDFLLLIEQLPSTAHADIADVIFSNCKVTCFNFYRLHGLHRTKFGRKDGSHELKLFQISKYPERFPETANDLSLEEWTSKLVHAHGRVNEPDTIHASHLDDYIYSTRFFRDIPRITSLVDAWGKVKVDKVERWLVYSLALCQVLKGWDSLDRLKALWAAIHRPETAFINKALLMPPLLAQPPARADDRAIDDEDGRPSKRARVTEGEMYLPDGVNIYDASDDEDKIRG
ncbi:hypothetical protein EDB81DRAFT_803238 [Dactylonectria macrodidyma]|uniref:Fungal N-terminal domain-containing protein n=1 Tax=Dactylonectria macrodidyma TaxID=307937 RepID=A0A9P9IVT0_9HYPO|nr:hypothetical protein EDB81DRAFT_803238 [Dactylonectria macrodidyma]